MKRRCDALNIIYQSTWCMDASCETITQTKTKKLPQSILHSVIAPYQVTFSAILRRAKKTKRKKQKENRATQKKERCRFASVVEIVWASFNRRIAHASLFSLRSLDGERLKRRCRAARFLCRPKIINDSFLLLLCAVCDWIDSVFSLSLQKNNRGSFIIYSFSWFSLADLRGECRCVVKCR